MLRHALLSLCFACGLLQGFDALPLFHDLETVRQIDAELCSRFPLTYNHQLMTGAFVTPSARMADIGLVNIGGAYAPPYGIWSGRFQPFRHLAFSANYRLFCGVDDPEMGKEGFGSFADRGANVKWSLINPEDSGYRLPGIAIGVEDFLGTRRFLNTFIVGTQVLVDYGLEGSFGWGGGRYTHGPTRGFFGSLTWFPWQSCRPSLRGFALAGEVDPIDYTHPEREPHPDGQTSRFPLNLGAKYALGDLINLSGSWIRGEAFAFAGSVNYNWGKSTGLLPKLKDPPLYSCPVDHEPVSVYRPASVMIQGLGQALECQGFRLLQVNQCNQCLTLMILNQTYRQECMVRRRLQHVLGALWPENIEKMTVILTAYGVPCQQYTYERDLLQRYCMGRVNLYEFDLLTPRAPACPPPGRVLYRRRLDPWRVRPFPRLETFWGSASGKFKYDLGFGSTLEGFLPGAVYYELGLSVTAASSLRDVGDFDRFHPSQLPNVLTDYVRYRQEGTFSVDRAYVQKNWNVCGQTFAKGAAGYFQVNYAGVAGELLWYPVNSVVALGVEGAALKKRRYHGLGFQSSLRHFDGRTPVYSPYSLLSQYFFNLYVDFPQFKLAGRASVGQFLAYDRGVRLEATRYFESGLRVTGWITITDAADIMHGARYFNRGIAVALPLDLFCRRSGRRFWNYGLAAWLRDAGAFIVPGRPLFEVINEERRW